MYKYSEHNTECLELSKLVVLLISLSRLIGLLSINYI